MNWDKYGECEGQLSFEDLFGESVKIDKPIRLIELFAGVGSQAMALRNIGADFEHYRAIESGTRSSLLFEVGRLLDEVEELPQILLMENVPQVLSRNNEKAFGEWKQTLEWKGYKNYIQILNAKDYGVAQSRRRCFMVSILGDSNYQFPKPIPLEKCMNDYLESNVDEKYYISSDKARELIDKLIIGGKILRGGRHGIELSVRPKPITRANSLMAREDRGISCIPRQGNGVCECIKM